MKKNKIYILSFVLYMFFSNFSIVKAENVNLQNKNQPEILSESAILIDAETGIVIYEKDSKSKKFPASITKIMTGLLAIEYAGNDFDQRVTMSYDAVFSLPYGSSNIAMNDNETLSFDECLYGIFLASANEVSNAVAEHISGNTEDFAKLMTERAKELGAKNTRFMNPHGLHDENHYTTAYDMALIMKEAVKNEDFLRYISTINFNIPPTERQPEERILYNSNKMIIPSSPNYYEYCVGGKTGYTDEAMHTLVTYAEKDGIKLICVLLKAEKNNNYKDTAQLFEYGFELYENQKILDVNDFNKSISVKNEFNETIGIIDTYIKDNVILNLPNNISKNKITLEDNLDDELHTSVKKDALLGTLSIMYEDTLLKELDIFALNDFEMPDAQIEIGIAENTMFANYTNDSSPFDKIVNLIFICTIGILAIIFVVIISSKLVMYLVIRKKYRHRKAKYNFSKAKRKYR